MNMASLMFLAMLLSSLPTVVKLSRDTSFLSFSPPFLVLSDEHVDMITCSLQVTCICHFVFLMSCQEPPICISGVD